MNRKSKNNVLKFLVLGGIVLVLGLVLQRQGNLISPLESTTMLMNLSSGEAGFALGDRTRGSGEAPPNTSGETNTATTPNDLAAKTAPTVKLTMETFTAQLAAAGVDVSAVSASMSAEGRSLDNLLTVVNSGRVSVADLAARLKGENANGEQPPTSGPESGSQSLFDFHWEDFGSVLYDLWVILAVTLVVIVLERSASWLKNRLHRATA
jgi:hypothetical protein